MTTKNRRLARNGNILRPGRRSTRPIRMVSTEPRAGRRSRSACAVGWQPRNHCAGRATIMQ
jgi:hypothetical protein